MTPTDLRLLCTALGFTAVVTREGRSEDEASRAKALARLIESFCLTTIPSAAMGPIPGFKEVEGDPGAIDEAIDRYKADLRDEQEARLPPDRTGLLQFYDRLLQRKTRREQRHFYATAHDDLIANRVLQLVDEEIGSDGGLL